MPYSLFDHVLPDGENDFREWTAGLQVKQRARLNQKIDMLELVGETLTPHTLTDTEEPGIRKLRVQGNVKLRPLLCRGPKETKSEYTFLIGAKEVQNAWSPKGVLKIAKARKVAVAADLSNRRKKHERVA